MASWYVAKEEQRSNSEQRKGEMKTEKYNRHVKAITSLTENQPNAES